jgi:Icc protein
MAEIFFRPMNRRTFIQTGLAAFGTLITLNSGCSTGLVKQGEEQTHLAFLADTHIPEDVENNYRGFYPYQNLQKVVPDIISASPDGVLIAGDLARLTGQPGDYTNLKKLIEPVAEKTPVFMGLGNHDNRENFLKAFDESPGEKPAVRGKYVTIVEKAPVRLIMLDSLLYTNKAPGLLGKAQRQWLENYLKESDETPVILCFHHTLSDGDGDLLDVPRLFSMIAPIRKVKAIVYGHSHVYGYSEFEGVHLINLPAVGYNFSDSDPVGWVEARLTKQGGDFMLHAVAGNQGKDGSLTKLTWRKG